MTDVSSERPPYIEKLRAETRGLPYRPAKRQKQVEPPDPYEIHSIFTVSTGERSLELGRREPGAKMLFGELWQQGELCILFADTNTGKSVLAVQIADSISRCRPVAPFACNAPAAKVLYIDFELSIGQFFQRYSHQQDDYPFSGNFLRAGFNSVSAIPDGFNSYDEFIMAGIQYKIERVKAAVLIIDNITCLRSSTESAVVALKLMQRLKALQNRHNLSILVLAHTPKRRNPGLPISADDLHGSKLLINFADSAFAIGKSRSNSAITYLKQIKQRNTRQLYGEDNVCVCRLQKPGNFLHFEFEGNSPERPHLLSRSAAEREELMLKITQLSAKGLSQRQISRELKIALGTVNKLMKKAGL